MKPNSPVKSKISYQISSYKHYNKFRKKEIINAWIRHVLSIGIEGLKKEYQDSPNGVIPVFILI